MTQSSNVISAGYDQDTQTLEIEFRQSGIYQYYNIPADLARQFLEAPSKGQFLNTYIKNAYPYSRVG
jgi:hypothetical protein